MKIVHKKFRKQDLTKEALQNIYLKNNQYNFYWPSAFVTSKTLLKYSCLFHFLSNPREVIFCILLKRNWSWERLCPHSWNQKNKRTEASPEVWPACLDLLLAVEFWHPACLLCAFIPCSWSPVGTYLSLWILVSILPGFGILGSRPCMTPRLGLIVRGVSCISVPRCTYFYVVMYLKLGCTLLSPLKSTFSWEFASLVTWGTTNLRSRFVGVPAWRHLDHFSGRNSECKPEYWLMVQILRGRVPFPAARSKVSLPSLSAWQAYFFVAFWCPTQLHVGLPCSTLHLGCFCFLSSTWNTAHLVMMISQIWWNMFLCGKSHSGQLLVLPFLAFFDCRGISGCSLLPIPQAEACSPAKTITRVYHHSLSFLRPSWQLPNLVSC